MSLTDLVNSLRALAAALEDAGNQLRVEIDKISRRIEDRINDGKAAAKNFSRPPVKK